MNADHVRGLAAIHCTLVEIAAVCGVSVDTIQRRFAREIELGRATGRSSLRRAQWKAAEAGNATMLIWLGKQVLGQRDLVEFEGSIGLEAQDQPRIDYVRQLQETPGALDRMRDVVEMISPTIRKKVVNVAVAERTD